MVRHLKIIQDRYGRLWLGPENVDPEKDFVEQGCWRCSFRDPGWMAWENRKTRSDGEKVLAGK